MTGRRGLRGFPKRILHVGIRLNDDVATETTGELTLSMTRPQRAKGYPIGSHTVRELFMSTA